MTAQDPGVGTPPAPRPSAFIPDPNHPVGVDGGRGSTPVTRPDTFDPPGSVTAPTTPIDTTTITPDDIAQWRSLVATLVTNGLLPHKPVT